MIVLTALLFLMAVMNFRTPAVLTLAKADPDSLSLVVGIETTQLDNVLEIVSGVNATTLNKIAMGNKTAVVVDIPFEKVVSFMSELNRSISYRYVEPVVEYEALFTPNDPYWDDQWGPQKIQADFAWNTTTGNQSILVAVIDTGIDYNHEDLSSNYNASGYDWVNDDNDPMDDHWHGTHVAGIVAATTNNSIGIAGMAQVQIMAEKVLRPVLGGRASGTSTDVADGIIHAANASAKIINLSLGGRIPSQVVFDAVQYAYDQGVLIVAAAGNDGDQIKHFPAALPEVVSVGATDEYDYRTSFSNYGDWLELAAPGISIMSTLPDDSYGIKGGTSFAAPHVAGAAALIWSHFPNFNREQVRAQLRWTTEDLGDPGYDIEFGFGRINAKNAVEQNQPEHDVATMYLHHPYHIEPGEPEYINCTVLNLGSSVEFVDVHFYANDTYLGTEYTGYMASGSSKTVSYLWNETVQGNYNITAYADPFYDDMFTVNNALSTTIWVRTSINVPSDYPNIQMAIDHSDPGELINVSAGQWSQQYIVVYTSVQLAGADQATVLLGGYGFPATIQVFADDVSISGFTLRLGDHGIKAESIGNLILASNKIENGGSGMWLVNIHDSTISDNHVSDVLASLWIGGSSNTQISKNTFESLEKYADVSVSIQISNCQQVTFQLNVVDVGFFYDPNSGMYQSIGIFVTGGSANVLDRNTVSNCSKAIWIHNTEQNDVKENKVVDIEHVQLKLQDSHNNTIRQNFFYNGTAPQNLGDRIGIYLGDSNSSRIYRNSFINFTYLAQLETSYDNAWNSTSVLEGNYWSDYNGTDSDGDGIGDTSYTIDAQNIDHMPLMNPYVPGDVNHDGIVNGTDLDRVVAAYGSTPGSPNWNPHCDIYEDGKIDIKDIRKVAKSLGKTWRDYWGV